MPPSSALATPTPMNQVPERRHEGGHLEADVNNAVHQPDERADGEHQKHREDAEIVVVHAVEHGHRQDHGRQGEHPLDREVDRSHQDDEGLAEPRTSGIAASWLIRTKLPKLRKLRLIEATITQSNASTINGAQAAARQRRFVRAGALAGRARLRDALRGMTFRKEFSSPAVRGRGRRPAAPAAASTDSRRARKASAVLDLSVHPAPDVVPVELGLRLDVAVVVGTWRCPR